MEKCWYHNPEERYCIYGLNISNSLRPEFSEILQWIDEDESKPSSISIPPLPPSEYANIISKQDYQSARPLV